MTRSFLALILAVFLALPVLLANPVMATEPDRSATGGAQTLEDILARQRGETINEDFRRDATGDPSRAAPETRQLGTLGGISDPEVWRALRYGTADVKSSSRNETSRVLIQDGGMEWLDFRRGPLSNYGSLFIIGTLVALVLFYLVKGRIMIDGEKTGRTVERFTHIERIGHWTTALSFIALAFSGLVLLLGRKFLIPVLGHDFYSLLATNAKWVHNNIAWAFVFGLTVIFFMWVVHNIPNKTDIKWLMDGGGIMKKGVHPPAKKFNAGQKGIFWSVVFFGGLLSLTGAALLFPYKLQFFASIFEFLNSTGLVQLVGLDGLPTLLSPQEEMQYAQMVHAGLAFIMIAIILAHIYIGSVGMEGAFDAMGSGQVEEQWAREHHSLWLEEVEEAQLNQRAQAEPSE